MQRLAQAWLILQLTTTTEPRSASVTAFQFLPMLLFGAWGGVLADRFDKRRLLYGTQIAAGMLALGARASSSAPARPTVWNVYLMSVLLGFVNVIDNPARQTFVLEMVGREELPNAVEPQQRGDEQLARRRARDRRHPDRAVRARALLLHQRRVVRRGDRRAAR